MGGGCGLTGTHCQTGQQFRTDVDAALQKSKLFHLAFVPASLAGALVGFAHGYESPVGFIIFCLPLLGGGVETALGLHGERTLRSCGTVLGKAFLGLCCWGAAIILLDDSTHDILESGDWPFLNLRRRI